MVYQDIDLPLSSFIALDWTLMSIALVPILIRISLRARDRGRVFPLASNIADGGIVLAWLAGIVLISINTWKNKLRMKYLDIPKSQLYYGVPQELSGHLLYVSWISLFFIYISLWASKVAFLAFYYSIFGVVLQGKKMKYALLGACIFTGATFLLHMCIIAFWCTPISANWNPVNGHLCSAVHSIESVTISTFTNIATDIVILSIPISNLMNQQFGRKEKAGLAFIFFMGSVSILAALVRFVTLKLVQSVPKASITHTIDVWALVEIVSSIIAICLPSLRTFVRQHRPKQSYRDGEQKLVSRSTSGNQSVDTASLSKYGSVSEKITQVKRAPSPLVDEVWLESADGERLALGLGRDVEGGAQPVVYVKRPVEVRSQWNGC